MAWNHEPLTTHEHLDAPRLDESPDAMHGIVTLHVVVPALGKRRVDRVGLRLHVHLWWWWPYRARAGKVPGRRERIGNA
jgi:hypothetical protein